MKVALSVKALQEIMDMMSRFVSKHATLPILENVYIKWTLDTIVFRATDMEKYIEVELPAKLDTEGALTVNAKTLADIVKTVEDDTLNMIIEESTDTMIIQSISDEFKIKGIPATEYVALPDVQSDQKISLQAGLFTTGINKVEFAVTEKNFSPVLTGVFMRTKVYDGEPKLVFVGTDSFRLAEYKVAFDGSSDDSFAIIVPKIHINDIKRVAEYFVDKGGVDMGIAFSDNMISFEYVLDDMKISCTALLIQGSFPEYENENIMPTTYTSKLILDTVQLDKSIRKISIFTRDINNYISIASDGNLIKLSSGETDKGQGQTATPCVLEGDDIKFGINGKYISDFLKVTSGAEVDMQVTNAEKPVIFKDKDDDQYTYVVRPLVK